MDLTALLVGDVLGVPVHPPTNLPNLFYVVRDIFGSKNLSGLMNLPVGPKIQNGRQVPDMAFLTFFLWEINSKLFFLT